ncbi:MAG: SET domain-containing protein [Gammaproteobacteria bacterium]
MKPGIPLVVRHTGNKGRGVFAGADIAAGQLIEAVEVIVIPPAQIAALETTSLCDYYYKWGEDSKSGALALGCASLYNHSYRPNARYVKQLERGLIEFFAIRDIKRDEEITINYNGDPDSRKGVWFSPQD